MIDVQEIRKDFAIFKNNPNLVYLDTAATSLTPDVVVDSMTKYYKEYPYSINRGSYSMALKPYEKVKEARDLVADFIGSKDYEVVFTKSTTSALNDISQSIADLLVEGDEIIVSNMEHHSNFLPWQVLAKKLKLKLIVVEAQDLEIKTVDVLDKITSKTKVIALHHVSNLIGDTVDVKTICQHAKDKNILTVIDGAQAAPHLKVDVKEIGCSFYIFSGHKVLGPTGIGVCYIDDSVEKVINPFEYGGDMVVPSSVDVSSYTSKEGNMKFEAGTPQIAEIIGLGEAIKYINKIGIDNIHEYEVALKKYAIEKLNLIEDKVKVYNGNIDNSLITFNIKNVAVHDAVSESFINNVTFDSANIAIRDGQHCNNLTMKYVLKEKSVLRASIYFYNTYEDIDKFVTRVEQIYDAWNN